MVKTEENKIEIELKCFHCGENCSSADINIGDKVFCCSGCRTVYEILDQNDLCDYYSIDDNPGITQNKSSHRNYDFLNDADLKKTLIDFTNGEITSTTFSIPQMHCSSCIWILENLQKLNKGVLTSEVNFLKKTLRLQYSEKETSLKDVVELLDSIGYEPDFNFAEKQSNKLEEENKKLYYRIGVAGFAFGNIMLLSFPEYLGVSSAEGESVNWLFNYLNLLLALPVVFYSASLYFESAIKGLRNKIVNIDVPIALGVTTIFLRSAYEILSNTGAGYFDSLAALVFLLLVGRLFQNKTYDALNFERNYKSYFPIAVHIIKSGKETTIPVSNIKLKDRLIIKNNELIPADSVLIKGIASIDYSFVTGESAPVEKATGDIIYAGGRQIGGIIEVDVVKEVSQSYLTQLWNNKIFDKKYNSDLDTITNTVSKYFTFVIISIAVLSSIYWLITDSNLAVYAFTSVLIIACPCALALSTPFTLGNALRILGKNKLYLKNTSVIEKLAKIDSIVFDKTGTLTVVGDSQIEFSGNELSADEKSMVKSLVRNSSHPLSRKIYSLFENADIFDTFNFEETAGKGISARINDVIVKIGSGIFVEDNKEQISGTSINTRVFLEIDGLQKGFFVVKNIYRSGFEKIINALKKNYKMALLSGDSDGEKETLEKMFPAGTELKFKQDPFQKLDFIQSLKNKGESILMFGDGLNDAGALQQSDVGISVAENINNFSPASDGILEAEKFDIISKVLHFAKTSRNIIVTSFIISFFYNLIGLSFAVTGTLSPVIAAILMPLSSISVVVFTTLATNISSKKIGL